jgi:uncharacterized protein YndB with AHSA1/START domain
MIDIARQVAAIGRYVELSGVDGGETVKVTLERRYQADLADVWDALTDVDRISRWMLPITGDLREGGTFSLEGNASGDILTCHEPDHLVVTFGGPTSVVDLRLTAEGDQTLLRFDHSVPLELAGGTGGALYVGPGWDGALLALGLYLDGELADDPIAAANSPEGQQFSAASLDAWAEVLEASGTADADTIAEAKQVSLAQFAPDLV